MHRGGAEDTSLLGTLLINIWRGEVLLEGYMLYFQRKKGLKQGKLLYSLPSDIVIVLIFYTTCICTFILQW
jgi:hypothetical protein